ncbi:MAG: hypothetical protein HWQ38_28190 [Nostoc sp. NMS7]|uniref:hypothetical protein n=1 Tax=unclassified Nostoc TaxID=2593658 RepID=UPI0025DF1A18|nr:hypothetical protein [Nostoc sp. NMS7]MBN3950141.1 hypothetical protein [Nostoc sp. NMS7]
MEKVAIARRSVVIASHRFFLLLPKALLMWAIGVMSNVLFIQVNQDNIPRLRTGNFK